MAPEPAKDSTENVDNGGFGRFTGPDKDVGRGLHGDRRLVVVTLGKKSTFVVKCYPEPTNRIFRKRFYHRIVDLQPKDWKLTGRETVLGGACAMEYDLTVTYQPTLKYAASNVNHV